MKFDPNTSLADGMINYRFLREFLRRRGWHLEDGFSRAALTCYLYELDKKQERETCLLRNPRFFWSITGDRYSKWCERIRQKADQKAELIIEAMKAAGLVSLERVDGYNRPLSEGNHRLTQLGVQLRSASWSPRLDRQKADRRIQALLERIAHINANPDAFHAGIILMGVFGSYIEPGRNDYGDIDIVLDKRILQEYRLDNYFESIAKLWQADHPEWKNDEEFTFWLNNWQCHRPPDRVAYYPERKTNRYLKKGDGYLSLHSIEERLDTSVMVFYTREEGLLTVPRRQPWPKANLHGSRYGAR